MPPAQSQYEDWCHLQPRPDLRQQALTQPGSRRGAISDAVRETLEQTIQDTARRQHCKVLSIDGEDDYIHILLEYPPDLSISDLVRLLKTNSSRQVRGKHGNELEDKLWGKHFWSPSYMALSSGDVTTETIKRYIENQREKG